MAMTKDDTGLRVLVTGGAGFIGSNLVHHLLGERAGELAGREVERVVTLDSFTYAGNPDNLEGLGGDLRHRLVEGDILDRDLVGRLLLEERINAVMHLAAESHVDRSIESPEPFVQTNVVGTLRLLDAALERHRQLAGEGGGLTFLHVSTDEVYGTLAADDPAFCESTPYAPNSPYAASKAASDHLARSYYHTYGLPVVTTNCSNNYGPRQFPEKLVPLMVQKVLRGESLPVYGDGQQVRDWLYVDDHVRGLVMALVGGRPGETYCIGGRCEMKNLDVVRAIIEAAQQHVPEGERRAADELIRFVADRPGHDRRYAIDPDKISGELGWAPEETFESGMAKTVAWYVGNGGWIERLEERTRYRQERLGAVETK
jgi:dTDP-glucose 4,6-dehydratase